MPNEVPPRVLALLAQGSEEIEFTVVVDVLRRAGIEVVVAGLDGAGAVPCSRGVRITPDVALEAVLADRSARGRFDLVFLPGGGEGSQRFRDSTQLGALLRDQLAAGADIAAICAAPSALAAHGVGRGVALTAHPSVREVVAAHGTWRDDPVVEDGRFVTSRGPGTAFDLAFALVRRLRGAEVAAKVRGPMMFA